MVFTSDAGKRWADAWTEWENYDKFFYQMVQWAMRPVHDDGKFSIATDMKDGKIRVVVTALDKDDQFLNFLNMSASASGPDERISRRPCSHQASASISEAPRRSAVSAACSKANAAAR